MQCRMNEDFYLCDFADIKYYKLMSILELVGKENVLEAVQYLVKKYGSNWIDYVTISGDSVDITDADVFVESVFSECFNLSIKGLFNIYDGKGRGGDISSIFQIRWQRLHMLLIFPSIFDGGYILRIQFINYMAYNIEVLPTC